jgi:hypothetical protein
MVGAEEGLLNAPPAGLAVNVPACAVEIDANKPISSAFFIDNS